MIPGKQSGMPARPAYMVKLVTIYNQLETEVDIEALNDILPNLKRLRILYLRQPKDISSQLVNSIGNLKHLRHLDLSCTATERLPESLKETLNTLNGLLDDAEEKQITKPAVQRWLSDARHAVFEAEDIMEVIEYEHLRSKDIKAASRSVRNRDILDKINASTCRTKEPDESLMEAMKGEKLLLVLDDAWNIKYNEWDKLLLPLRNVEHGRKIVVTTRDEDVAKVTQTVIPFHRLNVISDEYCWELFARHAFSGVNSRAVSHLEAFGREIVRNCQGLLLAAKTPGGLLHSVRDVKHYVGFVE
ncbi:hypothetical protein NC652_037434 [Populus alba x Populus x berolinensis]|nr:hypothetical protein NC652_037434 [Populus alba x Populus x berolinensis]